MAQKYLFTIATVTSFLSIEYCHYYYYYYYYYYYDDRALAMSCAGKMLDAPNKQCSESLSEQTARSTSPLVLLIDPIAAILLLLYCYCFETPHWIHILDCRMTSQQRLRHSLVPVVVVKTALICQFSISEQKYECDRDTMSC